MKYKMKETYKEVSGIQKKYFIIRRLIIFLVQLNYKQAISIQKRQSIEIMLQASVNEKDGSLEIPQGSKLMISYRSKMKDEEKIARMQPAPDKNHFFAISEEDDIDFKIVMVNSSGDRTVCFDLNVLSHWYGFVTASNSRSRIETLTTNGRKLRFISQFRKRDKVLDLSTTALNRQNHENPPVKLSQIKFNVKYSRPSEFTIYIKTENGAKSSLKVTPLSTVAELKKMVKFTCSLIRFKGKRLNDHETMANLGITEHSTLDITGKTILIDVKVLFNKSLQMEVSLSDTVRDLKMKVNEKGDIPVDLQSLYFKGNEMNDSTNQNLEQIGVDEGAKIFLVSKYQNGPDVNPKRMKYSPHECSLATMFPVNVKLPNRKVVTVYVCNEDTIQDLKMKVQKKEIDIVGNTIKFELFKNTKLLQDYLTLEAYDINKNDEVNVYTFCSKKLHFCTSVQDQCIFVKTLNGKTITIPYCGLETIDYIKEKIQTEEGTPKDQQKLIYAGKELEDWRILNDYHVRHASTLLLVVRRREDGCNNCNNEIRCKFHSEDSNQDLSPQFSERGVITFGDVSNQVFESVPFNADDNILIEQFVLELRLASVPLLL